MSSQTTTNLALLRQYKNRRRFLLAYFLLLCLFVILVCHVDAAAKSNQGDERVPIWKSWIRNILKKVGRRDNGKSTKNSKGISVSVIDHFLSDEDSKELLGRYKPLLRDSLHKSTTGDAKRSLYRTSHTVRLPPLGDELVFQVEKTAAATIMDTNNSTIHNSHEFCEDLQLACYGPDELYALHRDDNADGAAGRAATVLIYLQAPEEGGSTLFTNRPLEDEKYNGQPLRTEADAVELFRGYCQQGMGKQQRQQHTVVEAQTGRAAAWYNYHEDTGFVNDSTHGACPVIRGEKCVVQQWMGRQPNPLRNVAALFTCGAATSFRDETNKEAALRDVSTRLGTVVPELIPLDDMEISLIENDGPYPNLGGFRLTGGAGLLASPSSLSLKDSFSVSFWIRNVQPGTVLLSLRDPQSTNSFGFSAIAEADSGSSGITNLKLVLQRRQTDGTLTTEDISSIESFPFPADEWTWLSVAYDAASSPPTIKISLFSVGSKMLAHTKFSLDGVEACQSDDDNDHGNSGMEMVLLAPPVQEDEHSNSQNGEDGQKSEKNAAFVAGSSSNDNTAFVQHQRKASSTRGKEPHSDVSFIMIHDFALPLDLSRGLGMQIRRYDINL